MTAFDEAWDAEVGRPFPASLGGDVHALLRTVATGGPPLETGEEWIHWDLDALRGNADDGFGIDWEGVAATARERAPEWSALEDVVGPIPADFRAFLGGYGTPSIPCGLLLSRRTSFIDLRRFGWHDGHWVRHFLDEGLAEPTVIGVGDNGVYPAYAWMPERRTPDGRALWLWLGRDGAGPPDGMVVAPLGFDFDRVLTGVLLGAWDLLLPEGAVRREAAQRLASAPDPLRAAVFAWRDDLVAALAEVPDGPLHAGETLANARDELVRRCALLDDADALAAPDAAYVARIGAWHADPPVPPDGPPPPRSPSAQADIDRVRAARKAAKRAKKAEARAKATRRAEARTPPGPDLDHPEPPDPEDAFAERVAAIIFGFVLPGSVHLVHDQELRGLLWVAVAVLTGCGCGLVNLACAWASYRVVVAKQAGEQG